MQIGSVRVRVEWGHLLLLLGFACFVIWYNYDARRASVEIENTILILPTSILALFLCVVVAFQTVQITRTAVPRDLPVSETIEKSPSVAAPICYMVALGLYVFLVEKIGFDLATALFVAATMIVSGERRPHVIAAFSIGFAIVTVFALKLALPLYMPTLLF